MPRTAPQARWQTLKRYAQKGQMDAARELLLQMVRRYPHDTEAAAELERLRAGLPLRIAETAAERRSREQREAQEGLAAMVAQAAVHRLAARRTAELRHLSEQLARHLHTLREQQAAAPAGTNAFKKQLEQELSRRHKRRLRALALSAAGLALLCAAALVVLLLLRSHARQLSTELSEAYHRGDWRRCEALIEASDTGINRLVYPAAGRGVIIAVKQHLHATAERLRSLNQQLESYEKRGDISALSLEARATFLRRLRALPADQAKPLAERWAALCRPEQLKLDAQKNALLAELAELPPSPELTGAVQEDAAALQRAADQLQARIRTFRDACVAFDLAPELIAPTAERHAALAALLADATLLMRTEQLLSSARSFERHAAIAAAFRPSCYAPALAAARAMPPLPRDTASMDAELRALRHKLPQHLPAAVLRALQEQGPSFSQEHPATQAQVLLMEDPFTARTLRQPLYEITGPDGTTRYADAPPVVTEKNSVLFTPSELDPAHRIGRAAPCEWRPAHAVWVRKLDPTPLMRACNIARESFFLTAHLPQLLSSITSVQEEECPPLAKAYLYHILSELIRLDRTPEALGLMFAPTLRSDLASFRKLSERLRYPLSPSCWLARTAEAQEAEHAYARWFADHAHRDYAAEIRRELGKLLRERPRYLGYTDAEGKAHFLSPPDPSSTLWYYSRSGLTGTPAAEALHEPAVFSPIFTD